MIFQTIKNYSWALFFIVLPAFAATELDSVVAVVNDSVITQSQLNAMMFDISRALQGGGAPVPNNSALRKKALDQLIAENLQLQIASRNNITVSEADVDKSVANIAAQNKITVEQLKQALAKEGINYSKFRSQIHNQMILRQIQGAYLGGKVKVSDDEARNYIKSHPVPANANTQYHLDDLLIPVADSAPKADISIAKQKADDLLKQARSGKSFAELAASDTEIKNIDLDWRTISQLPAAFSKQIPTLNKSDVTDPIEAPNGFHLLKLIDKRGEANPLTIEEAKNIVFQEKVSKKIDVWIEQLRKTAYVKIMN